jgi:Protein of unknown function (DUF1592)/Protein of unknown function (DUF1588)/PA14 domain/Cytochrome C oxidase, cbb3-type, subunit III/Protein of unknown function (DUF1595)
MRSPALALGLLLALYVGSSARAEETLTGEQVYQRFCISCHGEGGQGTPKNYPKRLRGDRSVAQLKTLIHETMPEDDPESLTPEEAANVAEYIHGAFYSKIAEARSKPARIELSRLTVRQYKNAVADLIGGFRSNVPDWGTERGLKGQYFNSRGFGNKLIDRVDPEVAFDFQEEGPGEKFDAAQFSIRWEGSVLAPESGEYEFIVKTEHATRLWVNDSKKPLIDAWVKSGNDTEFRQTISLLGGRAYPIKLEFSKAKQGVDDSKDKKKPKPKPVKASIALSWRQPKRAVELIPPRYLATVKFPETFVIQTTFPPDDRSVGYEKGTSISKAWEQATADAALELSAYVASHTRELTGVFDTESGREEKVKAFSHKLVERAFRRPLNEEQKSLYVDRQFEEVKDVDQALKRVVLLALQSPRFLYREVGAANDGYDVASRLSFGLWDSLPDKTLLELAKNNGLKTTEEVRKQAERMLPDLRTKGKIRDFFLTWLRVDEVPELGKDPAKFSGFTPELASDLRTSLELFLDDVFWGEKSDFRELLLGDTVYLNERLAQFYGAELPAGPAFKKVSLNSEERAGVLTHPYLMANFAYTGTSSPIHRGVFIARGLLGRGLSTPPIAAAPLAPDLLPHLTTRERVTMQTQPAACQSCHSLINPLGFAFERFDAAGKYRGEEKGKSVDATGLYLTKTGETVSFNGARDFANFLVRCDETQGAFVEQLFHYLAKQAILAYGPTTSDRLKSAFAKNQFNMRALMVDIMAETALRGRSANP